MNAPQIYTDPIYIALALYSSQLATQKNLPVDEETRGRVEAEILRHLSLEVQMSLSPAIWRYYRVALPGACKGEEPDFLGSMLVIKYDDYPAVSHPDFLREFLAVVYAVTGIRFVSIASGTHEPMHFEHTGCSWVKLQS